MGAVRSLGLGHIQGHVDAPPRHEKVRRALTSCPTDSGLACANTPPISAVLHKGGPTSNQLPAPSSASKTQQSLHRAIVNCTCKRPASTMGDIPLQRWNTSDWNIFFGDRGPKIREITECLGLSCDSNHGILKFSGPESNKLSERVQELSKNPPKDLNGLLTSASRPTPSTRSLTSWLPLVLRFGAKM
ncbi:hypothetical protein BKA66DRAFT_284472 [Pyrenochaeta sp. MPI-SDFR-AT-0127]|nr:hypothetical protein BKA66DRAFT_284472 [Pyrenochaeta sp. MPI-SDFR-AT-0127]